MPGLTFLTLLLKVPGTDLQICGSDLIPENPVEKVPVTLLCYCCGRFALEGGRRLGRDGTFLSQ